MKKVTRTLETRCSKINEKPDLDYLLCFEVTICFQCFKKLIRDILGRECNTGNILCISLLAINQCWLGLLGQAKLVGWCFAVGSLVIPGELFINFNLSSNCTSSFRMMATPSWPLRLQWNLTLRSLRKVVTYNIAVSRDGPKIFANTLYSY